MSLIRAYYRGCMRKARYGSRRKARMEAIKLKLALGRDLNLYRCHFCQGWHLTRRY